MKHTFTHTSNNCAAEQSKLICMKRNLMGELYATSLDQGHALITCQGYEGRCPLGCVWYNEEGRKKRGWGVDGNSWETWSGKLMIHRMARAGESWIENSSGQVQQETVEAFSPEMSSWTSVITTSLIWTESRGDICLSGSLRTFLSSGSLSCLSDMNIIDQTI